MPSGFLPFRKILVPALIVALAFVSLYAGVRSVQKTFMSDGGIDLHPYWYYALFVRAGMNPYTAYAARLPLPEPVHYVDGSTIAPEAVRHMDLALTPANTAPLLLAMAPLAFLPWHLAKTVWLICSIALVGAIPWLAMRLLPPSFQLTLGLKWLAALSFYAMKGPRVAVANGQPSLLVVFLIIVTLLLRQSHWLWAGLALGVALGKYSLSLVLMLFLLLERRFRVVIVAVLVQVCGVVVVGMLDGGTIWETLQVYWMILLGFTNQSGIHISYLLRDNPQAARVLIAILSLGTLGTVWYSYWRGWLATDLLPVNSLLLIWIVLATYHRVYDSMVAILFLILCLSASTTWQLSQLQSYALGLVWLALVAILCLPGELVPPNLSDVQAATFVLWVERSVTVALAAMLVINVWLIMRTPRVQT